jgi:GalNAc5-diNAcBac-PP-undecaprenol beta-1,3-glucosyltransferase
LEVAIYAFGFARLSAADRGSAAPFGLTVVLATYNRPALVRRAVASVLEQGRPDVEILVVDDGSDEPLAGGLGDAVHLIRHESNLGVNAARNEGIRRATRPWVLTFDDDDVLLPGALETVEAAISGLPDAERYPVLKFGSSNSSQDEPFTTITPEHYLRGRVRGDLVPVLRRERFLAEGLEYPDTRVGGEHLLWLEVAAEHGIPAWATPIVGKSEDEVPRFTSARTQVARAREHAELQEETLRRFGALLSADYPDAYRMRHRAAATYWLLAGERDRARPHLPESGSTPLRAAAVLPRPLFEQAFLLYRRLRSNI